MDLVPTFARLSGATLPSDRKLDGHDIWPLLSGEATETPYRAFHYFLANKLNAVRSGPWKLELASGKLYNLDTDIGEATNVAAASQAAPITINRTAPAAANPASVLCSTDLLADAAPCFAMLRHSMRPAQPRQSPQLPQV